MNITKKINTQNNANTLSRKKRVKIIEKDQKQIQSRSCYTQISPIHKLLKPFIGYRVHSDILLFEEDRFLYTDINSISVVKSINCIERDRGLNVDNINVIFDDHSNFITTPWKYLVARLKSYGESNSYEWALMIDEYCSNYRERLNNAIEEVRNNPNDEMKNRMNEFIENKPSFWFDAKFEDDKAKIINFCFNWRLLLILGYEVENFISKTIKEGIPSLYPSDDTHFKFTSKDILKSYFNTKFIQMSYTRNAELINANNEIIPVHQTYQAIADFNGQGNLIIRNFYMIERNSDKQIEKLSLNRFPKENMEFYTKINTIKKEAECFTEKFYTKNYTNELLANKVCRLKKL